MATLIYSKSEIKIKKRQIKIEVPGERDNFMVRKKKKKSFFPTPQNFVCKTREN